MWRVEQPGPLTTIQDLGRPGYERFGVPVSGALDFWALRAGNALVGNAPDAAGLEALGALTLTAEAAGFLAVTGPAAGLSVRVNGWPRPLWTALYIRPRETVTIEKPAGGWAYVCVRGGLEVSPVMGSRSTYLRGGFGGLEGRALRAGDRLAAGPARPWEPARAGRWLPPERRPAYAAAVTVGVIWGPQRARFPAAAQAAFIDAEFTVTAAADRMGYRLSGPALIPAPADLISEPLPLGALQAPADGALIVMLADRPTVGGYPKPAVVARADVPLLAQCRPGEGRVRFRPELLAAAQTRYQTQLAALRSIEDLSPDNFLAP